MNALKKHGLFTTFAICAGIASVVVNTDYALRVVFMCCVYYLCAVGMNVLVGYAGQKSLGQAAFYAAGAYTSAVLTSHYNTNPWLAFMAAPIVAGLCGLLVALPALRAKGAYLAMVTMAFGLMVERIVTTGEIFGGPQGLYGITPLGLGADGFNMREWVWFAAALCILAYWLLGNLLHGRVGRTFVSLQADEIAAASVGVRVYRTKIIAFVIAAITAGIGGALVAQQNQYINSDFITLNLSIFILLMVLFGGAGSMNGALVGAVAMTLIDAALLRNPTLQHFVYGALLLFSLYVMPRGLLGLFTQPSRVAAKATDRAAGVVQSSLVAFPSLARDDAPRSGALLQLKGIRKAFGGVSTAKDVSFVLTRGHIHALIGPNGAGKTTLINMITGIVRPDGGTIEFAGRDITQLPPHEIAIAGIGRTFQNLRLFASMTVLENVLMGRHARMKNGFWTTLFQLGIARREERIAREKAMQLLTMLEMAEYADVPAGSLPYGLQRRAELARALATEPHLLLLDEPAAGLNPHETAELGRILTKICKAGLSILMVEHHMDMVMKISDHVVVLDYGVKIAEGTPLQVQSNQAVIDAYLGTKSERKARKADVTNSQRIHHA